MTRAGLLVAACALASAAGAAHGQARRDAPQVTLRANPSAVVAAEMGMMREARELGGSEAFRRRAAPGATVEQAQGPLALEAAVRGGALANAPARRVARTVWSSCDGSLAASYGRTRMADGRVGSFLTVWQRDRRGEYRWLFDSGMLDDPQPAPGPAAQDDGEDSITVTAMDRVEGKVADCPRGMASFEPRRGARSNAPPPSAAASADKGTLAQQSSDGTLRWSWDRLPGGARQVTVSYMREGAWQQAIAYVLPAQAG